MRLHPFTAVADAVRRAGVGFSVAFFAGMMGSSAFPAAGVDLVFVLAPLGAVLGGGYALARYLRFEYELSDGALVVRSGVLARQEREIPLRRVQNVDVERGLLQRLAGVAAVRVETAGGRGTEAELAFVSDAEAERLRTALRGRDATLERDESVPATDGEETDGTLLFELSQCDLLVLGAAVLRPGAAVALLAVPLVENVAVRVVLSLARPLGGPGSLEPAALTPDALLALALVALPLGVAVTWAASAAVTVVGYYGFRLGRVGDDLVYERGLLRRYSGSIPGERVQTLALVEPVLARPLGYAGLRVETAGYGPGNRSDDGPKSAVPLAPRERTLALGRAVTDFGDLAFERPPVRARRRYAVRYLLGVLALAAAGYGVAAVLGGFERWYAPLALLPAVPVAAHLKWRHRGVCVGERHVAVRTGFWRRTTRIVPYYRLQTITVDRSPFQRRRDLADLTADAASAAFAGRNATAYDLDATEAHRIRERLRERLRTSLRARHRGSDGESTGAD